jgi:hypothetical protein
MPRITASHMLRSTMKTVSASAVWRPPTRASARFRVRRPFHVGGNGLALRPVATSATIAREGEGAIPVRVAAMSSLIDWMVDERNFRLILFLASQTIAVGALVAIALRFATGTGLDPAGLSK